METPFLLERYRRDRRNLLEFLLSEGLIRAPSRTSIDLAGLDLDSISADYVLDFIESGEEFDHSEATRRYFDGLKYPIMLNSSSTNSYYFVSEPEISGSPLRRAAPRLSSGVKITTNGTSSTCGESLIGRDVGISGESRTKGVATTDEPSRLLEDKDILSLGLPGLSTGISDDEIRETAYEVLLACLFCGGKVHFSEEMKKEKKTNFLKGLRSKREGLSSFSVPVDCHSDFLDIIRVQMEISEAMDAFIGKGLRLSNLRTMNEQIDVPWISLNLVSALYKLDFPSERLHMQWQRRQANILEELLGSVNMDSKMREALQILLQKLRSIEEADELLGVFELTWTTLGITQKLHNALYSWVLFQQFVKTGEVLLLKLAVLEIQKVLSHKNHEGTAEASSLICSVESYGSKRFLCLVDVIFIKINSWCRYQLEDYHLHFAQEKSAIFGSAVNLAVLTQTTSADECAENKKPFLEGLAHLSESVKEVLAASNTLERRLAHKLSSIYGDNVDSSTTKYVHPYQIMMTFLRWRRGHQRHQFYQTYLEVPHLIGEKQVREALRL